MIIKALNSLQEEFGEDVDDFFFHIKFLLARRKLMVLMKFMISI